LQFFRLSFSMSLSVFVSLFRGARRNS